MEHETYPPLKYPTNPNLPRSAYPDVTDKVEVIIDGMAKNTYDILKTQGKFPDPKLETGVYSLFKRNFPNNQPYGLPGQAIEGNPITLDENGYVITQDQYAVFHGKVMKAGYISNFAYGYTAASGGLDLLESKATGWGAALYFNYDLFSELNKEDNQAIDDGYNYFLLKNPSRRKPNSFLDYF